MPENNDQQLSAAPRDSVAAQSAWAGNPQILTREQRRLLGVVLVAAFVLRLAVALAHPFYFPDSKDYAALGSAIAAGRVYRVNGLYATRMPGYPAYVAIFFWLFGAQRKVVLASQALCGAAGVFLTFLLARPQGVRVALLAAALVAFDPLLIAFSAALLTEVPFLMFFLGGLCLAWKIASAPAGAFPWRYWLGFAVCWIAAVYLRPSVLLCLPLVWAWIVICCPGRRKRALAGVTLAAAALFLSLLPWWYRNYQLFHDNFFRISTLEGKSLYESVYPGATGGPRQSDIPLLPGMMHLNEGQRDAVWTRRAINDMVAAPWRMVRLAFVKAARTWSPWLHAKHYRGWWYNVPMALWYVAVYVLAGIGLWKARPGWSWRGLLLIPILYFTLLHSVFLGSVRYRVPLMPIVEIFAATGAVWTARRPWLNEDRKLAL